MPYFEYTRYLILLLLLPVLWPAYRSLQIRKKKTIQAIGEVDFVNKLMRTHKQSSLKFKFLTFSILYSLLVLGLADLKSPVSDDPISRNGVDVMIAVDVSKSMLATDSRPNRLELARKFITDLLEEMPENRIGLVVFAGHAYLQMPLSIDHGAAALYLQQISTEMVPTQGTVIGEALQICQNSFNSKDAKNKAIVLITDGEDHDEHALQLANSLKNNGIMLNTVGIGTTAGTQLVESGNNEIKLDKKGQPVISKLNEPLLIELARKTDGAYVHLENPKNGVKEILEKINTIEKTTLVDNTYRQYAHYFYIFLIAAMLLLLVTSFQSAITGLLGVLRSKRSTAFQLFLLCAPTVLFSQNAENKMVYEGTQLYLEKKLDKALIQFSQSLQKNPDNHIARYNLGVTYFRLQQLESAERLFSETAERTNDPYLKQKSIYNKGVALSMLHKLPESISAYKTALQFNPKDQDARFNLEKALEELRQLKQKNETSSSQKQSKQNQPPKSKKEMEQWLEALKQKEQQIQRKIQEKKRPALSQPEKDW
jgi:Ca-activated chloride channel family protein